MIIIKLHVLQVQLSKEDIETILNTLIYDGKVERSLVAGQGTSEGDGYVKLYRSVNQLIPTTGLMRMPCGACPVSIMTWDWWEYPLHQDVRLTRMSCPLFLAHLSRKIITCGFLSSVCKLTHFSPKPQVQFHLNLTKSICGLGIF